MSLKRSKNYRDLPHVITINILRFELFDTADPVSMYSIYNIQTRARLNRDLELYFLEIPKYAKELKKSIHDMTKMERWLAYFANQLSKEKKEELAMAATEKGIEQGIEKGEDRFGRLMGRLLTEGKQEETKRAAADRVYRQELFHQYGID